MLDKHMMAMSGVTLVAALGIGFAMQYNSGPGDIQSTVPPAAEEAQAELVLRDIRLTSTVNIEPADLIRRDQLPAMAFSQKINCAVSAQARPEPQALVALTFWAPCNSSERVTVHHSGLMFTATTDGDGRLSMQVPALVENAIFIIELESGAGAVASTKVSDLDEIDRVALQWTGGSGFEIHAREFGADYGQGGHVWSGAADRGRTSQVLRLGDGQQLLPRMVEVYSFARNMTDANGTVALSIEAEVSANNCGREISAQTLEIRGGQGLRTRDLVLSMPNCNAIGDFLVLNNLVEDLKIAAN
ncbi:hypothetical protein [Parasedimentitalea psychrophila]|uniref:Translocase n=1 Tax=Parasedimentitalea psychrophila TaxID=2997337 RepID=A0A9Y2P8A3_9RHOB|nr:hypothetical protein [Parasedimentitalea psychrophila]WIY26868.1 hypothetical protein QPJ95_08125 [Parasedimentitalea psychrophila]